MKSEVEKPRPSGWGAVTDHPMIFSMPMILALLREAKEPGTGKTQTRRAIPGAMQDAYANYDDWCRNVSAGVPSSRQWEREFYLERLRIRPGDRVWCRETTIKTPAGVAYAADGDAHYGAGGKLPATPSIHMPRWASRLTLYVSEVRVQRLQDICEADARAEGAYVGKASGRVADNYATMAVAGHWFASARGWYADLWERLNGPGSWQANPFVAAYTFVPRLGNIDTLPAALMEDA